MCTAACAVTARLLRLLLSIVKAVEKYLKGLLQERFDAKKLPPVAKWNAERGQADRRAQDMEL